MKVSRVLSASGLMLCNIPLKVEQEPVLIRRLVYGVGCIG
jgi:hypothetical protein